MNNKTKAERYEQEMATPICSISVVFRATDGKKVRRFTIGLSEGRSKNFDLAAVKIAARRSTEYIKSRPYNSKKLDHTKIYD